MKTRIKIRMIRLSMDNSERDEKKFISETLEKLTSKSISLEENKDVIKRFSKGEIVFKIMSLRENGDIKNVGMVNTKEDYEKKLHTHLYQPFLYTCDLNYRLAYLYGCLHNQPNFPKNEQYIFLWREIGSNDWIIWFYVPIYEDNIYDEIQLIKFIS